MTLKEFKNTVTKIKSKETYIKQLMKNEYTPVLIKLQKMEHGISGSGLDPVRRYMEYVKFLVDTYTGIDVVNEDAYDVYDVLQETATLPLIFSEIGEAQIKEMSMLYAFVTDKVAGEGNGN